MGIQLCSSNDPWIINRVTSRGQSLT